MGTASSRSFRGRNPLFGGAARGAGVGGAPPTTRPFHRRTMSDSMANHAKMGGMPLSPLPPLPGSPNDVPMNAGLPFAPGMSPGMRNNSFGSVGASSIYSHRSNKGVYMGMGGEELGETEAFLAQTMGGGSGAAGAVGLSIRSKSHMRQHSVNLYMKSFKGKKQPRACKDAVFALLFLVQLVLISVIGLKFGPEALVDTAEELGPGEGLEDDEALPTLIEGEAEDEHVVLAYWNIIKMAYTCGAFAIIISALALAFMMAMSRRLVYVALVLSIGVSFAWGTIGIGISPKSFVPITGIIALMLTVGYMFVVWDRITFASANLTTALSGVRDNLGLVGVAFFFQFLALVCSIYYSFTFVGLHDAMYNGNMDLSDNLKIAVDVLLLVSYYWTYQVLRVSARLPISLFLECFCHSCQLGIFIS